MKNKYCKFKEHLWTYIIVCLFMIGLNLFSPEKVWAHWPILGWGIGLWFHWYQAKNIRKNILSGGIK